MGAVSNEVGGKPGSPKTLYGTIKELWIPRYLLASRIWVVSKIALNNELTQPWMDNVIGSTTVVRKSLCMSHEVWVGSTSSNQMIRLASIAKEAISEGEVSNINPCEANPIGAMTSTGNIFALRLKVNGELAQEPRTAIQPMLCQ